MAKRKSPPPPKPVFKCRNKWCGVVTSDVYWKNATGKPLKDAPFCAFCFEQEVRRMTRNLFAEPGNYRDE